MKSKSKIILSVFLAQLFVLATFGVGMAASYDYDGIARSDTPSIGAFEFTEEGTINTSLYAPQNFEIVKVTVVSQDN